MRKLLLALFLSTAVAIPAHAQHHHGGGYRGNWVAPLILGGIAGAVLTQPRYYPPPVVYTTPPAVPYNPGMVYPDYTYRPMYKMVDVWIPECSCYRSIQVQIN